MECTWTEENKTGLEFLWMVYLYFTLDNHWQYYNEKCCEAVKQMVSKGLGIARVLAIV